jgi:tetratricopeptide (TPR) repeat protein
MNHGATWLLWIAELALAIVLFGWIGYRWLKRSDDPARLMFNWILSGLVFLLIGFVVVPLVRKGDAFSGVGLAAVAGITLGIIWASSIGGLLVRPLENLLTGGVETPKEEPQYSMAESLRKKGNYSAALSAIHVQLSRFPNDFKGLMMAAEIHALDLRDLDSARELIQRLVSLSGTSPEHVSFGLNRLADWELDLAQDPVAARITIETIVQRYPDTETAQLAYQRLAHMPTAETLRAREETGPVAVPHITERLGLCLDQSRYLPVAEAPAQAVVRLQQHLDQHPMDWEAREELATLYAESLREVDQAVEHLEFLISQRNQPPKKVIQWLNQMADCYIKHGDNLEKGRESLERVLQLFPGTAAAEMAHNRIMRLKLEMNSKKATSTIKLGPGSFPERPSS